MILKMHRITVGSLALCAAMFATPVALAQGADSYPSRPVTLVLPLAPGGGADIDARVYAQKLSENLRQQFIMDYKPGAGTTIGTAFVAKAAPDGYTLLVATGNFSVNPALFKKLPYDTLKDFAPISMLNSQASLLLVPAYSPIRSMTDYIVYAKDHPGELNFGTTGVGSFAHLAGEWLHSMLRSKAVFIPYKGAGEVIAALAGNQIHVGFATPQAAVPLIKSGKLRTLGVVANNRLASLPDVPALKEQLPGYVWSQWIGMLAPAKTPPAIVTRLNGELVKIARTPEITARNLKNGAETIASTPEQFRKHLAAEIPRWRKLAQDAGIKLAE
jgi:tripartite-type tricarboxylate transporter receptor subunit TctC